jgi:peptidoglycan/LPS O-acetylase OafA/YrhL
MGSRLVGLDGLRGIAALAVFAHHVFMSANGYSRGVAFLAVDFFFMLSGYVMARTYEARLTGDLSAAGFLALRLRRLWPAMTVGAAIGVPVVWATYAWPDALPAMLNLLFVPWFLGTRVFPLNGPAWSIFFELVANLVHALVLCRLSTRQLMLLALACAPLLVAGGIDYGLDVGSRPENFLFGLPRVLLSYTIGMILWRSWRDEPPVKVSASFTFLAMPLFFTATAVSGGSWIANLGFIAVVCPMMIAGGLRFPAPSRWAGLAAFAGALSFPLYAVHGTVLRLASLLELGWIAGALLALAVPLVFPSVRRALGRFAGPLRRQPALEG